MSHRTRANAHLAPAKVQASTSRNSPVSVADFPGSQDTPDTAQDPGQRASFPTGRRSPKAKALAETTNLSRRAKDKTEAVATTTDDVVELQRQYQQEIRRLRYQVQDLQEEDSSKTVQLKMLERRNSELVEASSKAQEEALRWKRECLFCRETIASLETDVEGLIRALDSKKGSKKDSQSPYLPIQDTNHQRASPAADILRRYAGTPTPASPSTPAPPKVINTVVTSAGTQTNEVVVIDEHTNLSSSNLKRVTKPLKREFADASTMAEVSTTEAITQTVLGTESTSSAQTSTQHSLDSPVRRLTPLSSPPSKTILHRVDMQTQTPDSQVTPTHCASPPGARDDLSPVPFKHRLAAGTARKGRRQDAFIETPQPETKWHTPRTQFAADDDEIQNFFSTGEASEGGLPEDGAAGLADRDPGSPQDPVWERSTHAAAVTARSSQAFPRHRSNQGYRPSPLGRPPSNASDLDNVSQAEAEAEASDTSGGRRLPAPVRSVRPRQVSDGLVSAMDASFCGGPGAAQPAPARAYVEHEQLLGMQQMFESVLKAKNEVIEDLYAQLEELTA